MIAVLPARAITDACRRGSAAEDLMVPEVREGSAAGGLVLDDAGAWLQGVRRTPSPNCDARPEGAAIDLLVVHAISLPPGCFGTSCIEDFFLNRLDIGADPFFVSIASLRVSAHAVIARDGVITQYVPFTMRAWHAGVSCFGGRERCNDFAIGIELEGCDDIPYTAPQYRSLGRLCDVLMRRWPAITRERVVGHSDIAPGRKTDPGPAFDWSRLHRKLQDANPPDATAPARDRRASGDRETEG